MWPLDPSSPGTVLARKLARQAHRRGEFLDGELHERGVVGGAQAGRCPRFSSSKPGPGLGVHGRQLDPQLLQRRHERGDEPLEPSDLRQAVADAAGHRLPVGIPQPDLVLDARPRPRTRPPPSPRATVRRTSRGASSHGAPSGQLGVARQMRQPGRQRSVVQGARIRVDDQVGGARSGCRTARSR